MKHRLGLSFLLVSAVILIVAFVPAAKKLNSNPAEHKKAETGIQFIEENWAKAVAEARKQKKMIFIDAYTSWCGPCRMLKENTFTDKAAGEFFNKHFINIALDMEKGDGIAFAQKYQIAAYPTLLIMDADQKSVSMSEGYINPAQLIEFGKYVINKVPKVK
ncbi:MAG: thioredoxin family protein [Ferruginibacter sp.]